MADQGWTAIIERNEPYPSDAAWKITVTEAGLLPLKHYGWAFTRWGAERKARRLLRTLPLRKARTEATRREVRP